MVDRQTFALAFQQLCHAFGNTINLQTCRQYYKAFEDLTGPQVTHLVRWAIDNLDTSFPRIAVLKRYATAQGWYARTPSGHDDFVFVNCDQCGGHFAIRRSQLEQDAQAGRIYRCVNYHQCPVTFPARAILEQELS